MEEETTTPVAEESAAQAQAATEANTEAATTTAESTEQQTTAAESGASEEDAELDSWATNKGLELDSDNARKAAKMAREAEKAFHAKSQKSSELEKAAATISDEDAAATAQATGQDPELIKRLQRVEVKESVRDFWNGDGVDKAYEPAMIELLKTKPYLAGDLDALYASAVMKSGGVAAVKSQGGREALETLAQKQQAASPKGNATTRTAPKTKDFKDLSIKDMEAKLGFARR